MSRRQTPNLKSMLTKADLNRNKGGSSKCNDKRCGTCAHINECSSFTFKNDMSFNIKYPMNCKSKNLIYVITCNGCKEHYIGQTGDHLHSRMRVHKKQIKDPSTRQINVSQHIDECASNACADIKFSVTPLYKVRDENKVQRIAMETRLINIFKPTLNKC